MRHPLSGRAYYACYRLSLRRGENHKFNSLRCAEEASRFGMKTRIELWKSILKPSRSLVPLFSPLSLALYPKFIDDVIYVNKSNLYIIRACDTRAMRVRILEKFVSINDTHLIKLARRFAVRWESLSR